MPFDVCQGLVIEAANELITRGRFKELFKRAGASALTPADVRQLPNGAIQMVVRSANGNPLAIRSLNVKDLVEGQQFLKNAVTVSLIRWLRDSQPSKAGKRAKVKSVEDVRRNRRDRGRR